MSRVPRRCAKQARIVASSSTCAPMVIRPSSRMPSSCAICAAMSTAACGSQPDFDASPDSLTSRSTPTVIPRATGTAGDALRQFTPHRFDGVDVGEDFTDLVGLQLADEMERDVFGVRRSSGVAVACAERNPRSAHSDAVPRPWP